MKKEQVNFKLDNFEGPLDLLLFLIKNKKLDISFIFNKSSNKLL